MQEQARQHAAPGECGEGARPSRTPFLGVFIVGLGSGAATFWPPSVLLHAVSPDFGALPFILTIICPLFLAWTHRFLHRRVGQPFHLALSMLLGVWLCGPLANQLGVAVSGGSVNWSFVAWGTLWFPMITLMVTAYDGTLLAVIAATVGLPLVAWVASRRHRR